MTTETKPYTLTLNKEFRHAYYQGKSRATPYFICYIARGQAGKVRYGITTSKKIGNAVKRNRARRLIRAAFLSIAPQLPVGKDYVFVARENILTAKSYQVAAAMKKCIKQLSQPHQKKSAEFGQAIGDTRKNSIDVRAGSDSFKENGKPSLKS